MFVDEVVMKVEAGTGGNGCMAFREESLRTNGGDHSVVMGVKDQI